MIWLYYYNCYYEEFIGLPSTTGATDLQIFQELDLFLKGIGSLSKWWDLGISAEINVSKLVSRSIWPYLKYHFYGYCNDSLRKWLCKKKKNVL